MKTITAVAIAFVLVLGAACLHDEEGIEYQNRTGESIVVEFDGERFALDVGETRTIADRREYFPTRYRVTTQDGRVVFDELLTWDELRARDFTLVFE